MIQVKDGGGLDQCGLGGDREKWAMQGRYGSRATGFADALEGGKRKKGEQSSIDLESRTAG